MTMRAHVLQHVPFEDPGSIRQWLDDRGAQVTCPRLFAGDAAGRQSMPSDCPARATASITRRP